MPLDSSLRSDLRSSNFLIMKEVCVIAQENRGNATKALPHFPSDESGEFHDGNGSCRNGFRQDHARVLRGIFHVEDVPQHAVLPEVDGTDDREETA